MSFGRACEKSLKSVVRPCPTSWLRSTEVGNLLICHQLSAYLFLSSTKINLLGKALRKIVQEKPRLTLDPSRGKQQRGQRAEADLEQDDFAFESPSCSSSLFEHVLFRKTGSHFCGTCSSSGSAACSMSKAKPPKERCAKQTALAAHQAGGFRPFVVFTPFPSWDGTAGAPAICASARRARHRRAQAAQCVRWLKGHPCRRGRGSLCP